MSREKWITAAELDAKLEADPEFVRRRAEKRAKLEQMRAEWDRAQVPLVADLREAGIEVKSVWDLVSSPNVYDSVLPILVDHLQREYPPRIIEGIARALAVPNAHFAWDTVVRLYRESREYDVRSGLGVTISAIARKENLPEVIEIVRDRSNGETRGLMLDVLEKTKDPRGLEILQELASDPELEKEIAHIFKKIERRRKKRQQ